MHREIKFRGLRTDGGGWVYGDLVRKYGKAVIITETDIFSFNRKRSIWIENEVHPETVGQFTGLKDKNGNEIFEGDKFSDGTFVIFKEGKFGTTYENNAQGVSELSVKRCLYMEIIGNIQEKTETK
jgi:uncharacterized phage protein (TIGR01671 family)